MTVETYLAAFTAVPSVLYILVGILGLCVGSFLNVVIYRVPLGMSIATPASHCPNCDTKIRWYDNIPVVSYCLLGGKCRKCRQPISFRYTAVELANTALWLLCAWHFREHPLYAIVMMITVSALICVFFIDLEHMIILDRFQILLGALAILATFLSPSPYVAGFRWFDNLIGGVSLFAAFWLIGFVFEKALGREALGGGDIKLAGVMGFFLGWQRALLAVLIASLVASVVLIVLGKCKKSENREYPFGPFLTAGFFLSAMWGDTLIFGYLSLLS